MVSVSPDIQLARLTRRDGTTEEEAKSRINAQMPLAEKVQRADVIIDNDGSEAALNRKIAEYGAPLASVVCTLVLAFSLGPGSSAAKQSFLDIAPQCQGW